MSKIAVRRLGVRPCTEDEYSKLKSPKTASPKKVKAKPVEATPIKTASVEPKPGVLNRR